MLMLLKNPELDCCAPTAVTSTSVPISSVLAGLGLGFSLIIAIGAQNLFVLRQGIRREHVFAVAAICALSDLALIVVGVSGIGAVLTAVPWLVEVVRWAGAAFLVVYGCLAARRAIRPSGEVLVAGDGSGGCRCGDGCRGATGCRGRDTRGIRSLSRRDRCTLGDETDADLDRASHRTRRGRADLPRADLAQPARLPRHRVPARLGREHARRRAMGVRPRREPREHRLVLRPGLRRAAPRRRARRARARGGCSTGSSPSS